MQVTLTVDLPGELVEAIVQRGLLQWTATAPITDGEHLLDLEANLARTRDNFDLPTETQMHCVEALSTGRIIAMAGNSPNASSHARLMVGLWNALYVTLTNPNKW